MRNSSVVADDFGLHSTANKAVIKAWNQCQITAASVLVTGPAVNEVWQLHHKHPSLPLGLHFNIVEGMPVSPTATIPSLVQKNGAFYPITQLLPRLTLGLVNSLDIETELNAQLQCFVKNVKTCDHVNSHQNTHLFGSVWSTVVKGAQKYRVKKIRGPVSVETRLRRFPAKYLVFRTFQFLTPRPPANLDGIQLTNEAIIHPGTDYD